MTGRIVLLVTSPRLPAGLLTAQAWDLVRTHPVFTGADTPQVQALRAGGATVAVVEPSAATLVAEAMTHGTVVWLLAPGGDEELVRTLGLRLAREPGLAAMELAYGSWDPPGARVVDVVTVVDQLVSPGGDPWLAQFSGDAGRARLARYLLEEAYEGYDALRSGDLAAVREELGDVLLQVVLHARLAACVDAPADARPDRAPDVALDPALDRAPDVALECEPGCGHDDGAAGSRRSPGALNASGTAERECCSADEAGPGPEPGPVRGFDLDDVAGDLVMKLIRRNPHVFEGAPVADVEEITRNWEQIKHTEKARASAMDGISLSQPALALAAKVLDRAARAGITPETVLEGPAPGGGSREDDLGAELFAAVGAARADGLDAEGALRRAALSAVDAIRRVETAASAT